MTKKEQNLPANNPLSQPLHGSEERFRIISELTSDFAYVGRVEPDGTLTPEWVSDAFTRVTGYTVEEIRSQGLRRLVHPDDWPSVREHIKKVLSGQSDIIESRISTRSGEVRWLRNYARPVWDDRQARVALIYGAAQDITDSKRAEMELRESEERFSKAFNANPDPMTIHRVSDGRYLAANDSFLRITGFSKEEVIGQTAASLNLVIASEDTARWRQRLREEGSIHNQEILYRVKSGEVRTALFSAEFIEVGGEPCILAVSSDITERKRLEREREELLVRERAARREAEHAHQLSKKILAIEEEARAAAQEAAEKERIIQERLTLLVEASSALLSSLQVGAVLSTIVELAKQVVASDAYAVWAYKADSGLWQLMIAEGLSEEYIQNTGTILTGVKPAVIPPIIAEDVTREPMLQSQLAQYQAEGIQAMLAVPLQIRGERAGTISFYYKMPHHFDEVEVRIAKALANLAATAIGTAELYEEQMRLREEAERANRLKDEFLATVSHELRTPLNAIIGWTRLLRDGGIGEQMAARAVETIERNAQLQARLIEDLLDISRIITGRLRLNVQPVDLSLVVAEAVDVVRPAAEAKNIRLDAVLDPSAGPISGDPDRLRQIVWNLLSNAVKFTPKGGRVQARVRRLNSLAEVTVSDTGQGINPEFLPYVFEPFRQADSSYSRKHGGLGIGLAIVRQLVELHGGSASVHSAGEGQGATFTVQFPLMIVHAPAARRTGSLAPGESTVPVSAQPDCPPLLKGMRLLVVEDEPDSRELLKMLLEQCGAQVTAAASAEEALQELSTGKVDLMISDIEMPGEDGYALIRKIRSGNRGRQGYLPAIALTAHVRAEDRMRALRAGYDAHVAKPVDMSELVTVIESLSRTTGRP